MDYKATILLPKTAFPMRAELPKREPAQLAAWREADLYGQIMAARRATNTGTFVLHDGPPFANGDAHMGHALNMVLKDLVLKVQNMSGRYAPFVPGWDCHGLPIEHKVMKELGAAETDPVRIREKCEATARHFIGVQREQFRRLGVFGDWEHPYLTLDPAYEAETLRVFAALVEKNFVYQGLRPVLWSTGCQTALAEAEIEYKEKVDPAIYVKFKILNEYQGMHGVGHVLGRRSNAFLLIWTTTPWTLPANLAIAISPDIDYAAYDLDGQHLVVATELAERVFKGRVFSLVAGPWKGSELVGLTYRHPFLDDGRTRQIYAADFVTADAGTGLVHIAPGHGQDDYILGQQVGLPVLAPVDDRGCLTAECGVPELVGQYVFKANPLIIKMLEDRKMLFAQEEYRHEYPHCWRSKTPIVFRAVKQWFIKVDAFRAEALEQIGQVQWIPANGQNRIRGAVESRPDWCISRQRTWGVPLPVFYGEGGQPLLSPRAVRAFADLAEKEGAGVWFSRSADELAVALNAQAPGLNLPLGLRKGRDTLDVWIDSGTSWAAVLKRHPDLTFPADLYLEGSDQHRGWFQSSLLTSVAVTGRAPYRAVLTNGFVVDQDRKKLSKSGEGYQKPVDLMTLVNEHGADVLRLWVASQDYQDDIPFSHDILARVADSYRSIRNTLRILLGNLSDFDPAKDAVARDQWLPLDEYMDSRWREVCAEILAGYAEYDFARVYQAVNRFCAVDLSAFYVDVLKDRLYCDAPKSALRRSAQTVLHRIAEGLIKLLAPVLPFTAEEAWKELGRVDSVHLEAFPAREEHLRRDWTARMGLRDEVNAKLELARKEKRIGKSLEAVIGIPKLPSLDGLTPRDLDEFFAVSGVTVHDAADIRVARAEDEGLKKCIRCWKYYPEIGSDPAHPELCARCTAVVLNWVGEGK